MIGSKHKITTQDLTSWAILAAVFIYMWTVNFFMPLHRDDYEYSLIWDTFIKLENIGDVFQSLYRHYFMHGGRMTDFFVLDNFLVLGKAWFNPFNAFLFIALIVLIYWHAQRKITLRFNPYILSLIIGFCWLGIPHFAEVNIWMTGSCDYLVPMVLIFTMLLPYHFDFLQQSLKDSIPAIAAMFLLGLAASMTIENTAAVLNFVIAAYLLYSFKTKRLKKWMVSGFFGAAIGFLLLVAAPGNFVRSATIKSNLLFHFTNIIAATGEMLLYALPIVLFFVLARRMLVVAYAKQQGMYSMPQKKSPWTFSYGITIAFILLMVVSYINEGFLSKWLANWIYDGLAVRLGVASAHLKLQFFNTMSGLEEMLIYILTITVMYQYIFTKLALRKKDIKELLHKVTYREMLASYPVCQYTACCIALAVLNNLVMIASPSFPARTTYGAVVFLIIGAVSLLSIPEIKVRILTSSHQHCLAILVGIAVIPMAIATFAGYAVIHQENTRRMVYVEQQVSQGAKYLELEPISLKNRVLRHIYFVELNNGVSKYGFCRYYGLENVQVRE
ncbi:MAG: DUF6056 family protein [Pelosinus sp.]|nr:DUF6056 family protein [Pelosinus sp.]